MAFRPRTDEFVRMRSRFRTVPGSSGEPSDQHALLEGVERGDGRGGEGNMKATAPMFMRLKESVHADMGIIRGEMRELRTLYKRRRKILFDTQEIKDIDQQIGIHVANIKGYFKGCEHAIRQISTIPAGISSGKVAEDAREAETLRKNIQRSLATELTKLSQEFRLAQKMFLQDIKNAEQGGKEVFDIGDFEENPDEERMRQMETQMIEKGLSDEQIQEILLEEGILEERHQEIRAIVDSITDIHEMFRDLNQLVVEQGTLFDRIECNVESTAESMKGAVGELKKAENYQKKSRMIMCILFLVLLVVGFGLALFVKAI